MLSSILVKAGEIVKPGQKIGVVGAPGSAPPPPPSAAQASVGGPTTTLPATTLPATSAWRTPSISFPQRLTANGQRISDLPEANQSKAPSAPSPPPPPPPPPSVKAAKRKPGYYSDPPPRRKATAKELDLINSGGAW